MFDKDLYLSALNTLYMGRKYVFIDSVSSTNDFLTDSHERAGYLAIARVQTKGRGRSGKSWFSYDGGLAFSVVLPELSPQHLMPLNIIVGYSVAETLKKYAPVKVKWPNDCVTDMGKICGTLIDTRFKGGSLEKAVLGIGINLFETDFPKDTVAMGDYLSKYVKGDICREVIVAEILNELEKLIDKLVNGNIDIVAQWPLYSANIGKNIIVNINGRKFNLVEKGIDSNGFLITEGVDGERIITSGEIGYDFGC